MNAPRTVILKLVSAIAVAGEILRADSLVEVTEAEAKDLLHRGKAVIHHEPQSVIDAAAATIESAEAERLADEEAERAEREAAEEAARVAEEQAEAERRDAEQAAATAAGESGQGTQAPPQTDAKAEQPTRRRNSAAK